MPVLRCSVLATASLLPLALALPGLPAHAAAPGTTDLVLTAAFLPAAPPTESSVLERFPLLGGARTALPTGPAEGVLSAVDASDTGDRIVVVRGLGEKEVALLDVSGTVLRTVATADRINGAWLTASGNRVIWTEERDLDLLDNPRTVYNQDASGGPVTTVATDVIVQDVIGDDLLIAQVIGGNTFVSVSLSSRAQLPVQGLVPFAPGSRAEQVTVSPSGDRIAFVRRGDSGCEPSPGRIDVAPLVRTGDALSVGASTTVAALSQNCDDDGHPAFSHDGTAVWFSDDTDLRSVPVTGGLEVPLGPPTADREEYEVLAGRQESTPPAAPSRVDPAVRTRATAAITYALPADPTASLVIATRTAPGLPPRTLRAIAPQPLVDTGVVSGRTYTYSVRQVDRSGNAGPAVTTVLRQSAPPAAIRVSGQQLVAGQFLRSRNGVRLRVNPDGNLVALSPRGNVLFQTRTRGARPVLRVNPDGNLVLLSGNRVLWHARTAGAGSVVLVAQDDGNVVLYRDRDGRAVWSTRTGRFG